MHVSVIIPSYKGEKKLPNILKALQNQSYNSFAVIISVDGRVDNSIEVINSSKGDLNIQIIDRPNRNRSATRNNGVAAANGDLLIFFDDDMRPNSNCVEAHVKHHQLYSHSIAVGAQLEEYDRMQTDIQQYKAFLSRKWLEPLTQCQGPLPQDQLFLTAANFSIPASIFRQLNGFDERLSDAEDFDLAIRAYHARVPIFFNAKAVAWHDDFITCQSYVKRLRQYKQAHDYFQTLKPELYKEFNHYTYNPISPLRRWAYHVLSQAWIVRLIDCSNYFKVLPKRVRYRLYDAITTGLAVYFPEKAI